MKTQNLGNSDLAITPLGFGAWAIGGDWEFGWGAQHDTQSVAAIHRALELGMNWIDTAAVYGLGHSEEVVARALRDWRGPQPYVFTKCGMAVPPGEVALGWTLRHPAVTGAIVGARNPKQVDGVIGAMSFRLSPGEVSEVEG